MSPTDSEKDLDLKMLTVATKAEQPDIFSICLSLFSAFCRHGHFNADSTPAIWEEVEKYQLDAPFWGFIADAFGYASENPQLTDLLIRLLVMDFASSLKTALPPSLNHFKLDSPQHGLNASVFISQWRHHLVYHQRFTEVSKYYEKKFKLTDLIYDTEIESLLDVMTFEAVEKRIILEIRDRIPAAGNQKEFDHLADCINQRLTGYWAGTATGHNREQNLFRLTYRALAKAIALFQLRLKYESGLSYSSPESMFKAYADELYLFDKNYRSFHRRADQVEMGGWDILKNLHGAVEDCYSGWFMDQLALAWGGFMDAQDNQGLLADWSLPGVKKQSAFYKDFVSGVLQTSSRTRVFVIISDAFRYEVAEELTNDINRKYRFQAEMDAVLGVLPSYTGLGMVALLPHESITYSENGDLQVNGKPVQGLDQRAAVLADYEGTAIQADKLIAMNKQQGRDFVKPHRLIYIYHNQIDAVGDKQATEHKTFEAVQQSIEEVGSLVSFIINSLNGGYVAVTADHGFIYQDKPLDQLDKCVLDVKPSDAIIKKKRYILGHHLGHSPQVWKGDTRTTAGTADPMEFWVPKGANRFHFTGGAKFFHGGAMLQEVVVPVVTVRELRGKQRAQSAIQYVGVSLLGTVKKIVTNRHRFEFIQTEAVSERMQKRTLVISLRDGDELISNEETVSFDSKSSSLDDRKKSTMMMLKSKDYDNKKEYSLVLRDSTTNIEYDRIPVHIDLAFRDEF